MPGLRENITSRLSHELQVDPEFASIIPPLTPDEFSLLEQSIIYEGCRDAIIVWGNIIIDGHNRYRICTAHNIPYRTKPMDFASRNEAMLWMFQNQLARRNLNDFQRIEMARKFEEAVKTQAQQRMLAGKSDPVVNSPQGSKSRDILGAMAGVSPQTYEHAVAVLDNATPEVIEAVRKGDISINKAYTTIQKIPKKHHNSRYWQQLINNAQITAQEGKDIEATIALLKRAIDILNAAVQTPATTSPISRA